MTIKWTVPVLADLYYEAEFISYDNLRAVRAVLQRIRQSVKGLKQFSEMGRSGREVDTRELVIRGFPYLVVYQITDEVIEILTVFHTAKKAD